MPSGWELRLQTSYCDTFELHLLTQHVSHVLHFHISTINLAPLPLAKILVICQRQATALYLPFYNIFVPEKVPLLKIFDDVIACNLWFAPSPPIKNFGQAYGYNGYLPPVTVTSDVKGQFYVGLFFGLELVVVVIRVGAKFRSWIWLILYLKLTLTLPNPTWMFCSWRQMWLQPVENINID